MAKLTSEHLGELDALRRHVDAIGGPSFQWRPNYRSTVLGSLHRMGLITWRPKQAVGFGPSFAAVNITPAGRAALSPTKDPKR